MKISVLSFCRRIYKVLTNPAPLDEFKAYDDYWNSRNRDGRVANVLDRYIIIASNIPRNANVLDFGCGDGSFLSYLKRERPDCNALGVDLSASAVGMTLNKGCKAMKLDPGKTLHEQVKGDWDVVIMMEIIEHIPNAEDFVREVVDLDPEILFITIPNVGYILHRIRLALCGRFPVTSIFYHMREHLRFWTVKDFIDWAPTVNLRVEKYYAQCDESSRFISFWVRALPALFAGKLVYKLRPKT